MQNKKRLSFPSSNILTTASFELLHDDLWGPYSTLSLLGQRYFLTLMDNFSRNTWVIFLKTKDQTKINLINFVAYIENLFHTTLKCLRSDNGKEFLTLAKNSSIFYFIQEYLNHKSCPETLQKNGVVERKH